MQRKIYIHLLLILSLSTAFGQNFPVKTVFENGPRDKKINMIFLGDGYRITEMSKYFLDVQATVDKIFSISPYEEYKSLFNVYAIEVPSNESGTDHSGSAADCGSLKDSVFTRDTYFDTSFDNGSIHRLLVAKAPQKVTSVLLNNFPEYDIVLMVVNHSWYGGSGGWISVFSTNGLSSEVAIHETGHSFAHLADEYDYGSSQPARYDGINVTFRTKRDSIPWKIWIADSTPIPTPLEQQYFNSVGLFEGAYYTSKGMYRPKVDCKMRNLGAPFCEVCMEQHIKSIFDQVELIDEHLPATTNVTLFTNSNLDFSIAIRQLSLNNISTEWILDGIRIAQNKNSVSLNGSALSIGLHSLTAVVKHSSALVKNDPNKLLESFAVWNIDVKNPTGVDEVTIPAKFALERNYPNPFNPETTISYQISEISHVTLKIYDMLGREVATLVNEEKAPGKYNSQFSIINYPLFGSGQFTSGVYFYKLNAGQYSQTKKMILLK